MGPAGMQWGSWAADRAIPRGRNHGERNGYGNQGCEGASGGWAGPTSISWKSKHHAQKRRKVMRLSEGGESIMYVERGISKKEDLQ